MKSFGRFLQVILILCVLLIVSSCKTIKPDRPAESYTGEKIELQPSLINVPLDMNISDLETLLNKQLNGLIYESDNIDKDNYAVKAWKKENIKIGLDGNTLAYRIPLKLWIKAGFKVSKFGFGISDYHEINAEIALNFKTALTLNPDWTVTSITTTDGYEWLSTPVVKVGPVDIPITFIADRILKSNQKTINSAIDKAVQEKLELKKYMQDAWITLQKPVKVNDEYNIWLRVTPQDIQSTPISGKAGKLRHIIGIKSITEAFIGGEPAYTPNNKLPNLKIQNTLNDDFLVNLVADLPFTKANEMAKSI